MVVHEFAHGILSRVEDIRVKSMGIVMLLVPIAAFVEPDDDELFGSEKQPAKASRLARVRILSAGVIANFITAAVAMALFFGPVMSAVSPIDRVVVADVENDSIAEKAGIARNMIVYDANGVFAKDLDELRSGINGGIGAIGIVGTTARLNVSVGDGDTDRQSIALNGNAERGILIVDTFDASPARAAGMPERFVITGLEGVPIAGMEDFRARMNLTRPGQDLLINTNRGDYTVKLAEKGDGTGLIGISISGDALYMSGAIFQQFPASAFLGKLKQMPSSGIIGFYSFMTLPFTGIPGFTENGFQEFGGWISHFFEPDGWAEPIGGRIFWIANALLWIGWINLYAGLFNSLPAIPLDGGHIFRDVVQGTLERFVNVGRAERITRSVVSGFAWLIFASLFLSIAAPYMAHGLPI
jgi:membrane-associated protease RseP (regulator of RpoE activity)